jgi:hypothetical protein
MGADRPHQLKAGSLGSPIGQRQAWRGRAARSRTVPIASTGAGRGRRSAAADIAGGPPAGRVGGGEGAKRRGADRTGVAARRPGPEGGLRPAKPRRWILPITALRLTDPKALAIWLALCPWAKSAFRRSTRASDQPPARPETCSYTDGITEEDMVAAHLSAPDRRARRVPGSSFSNPLKFGYCANVKRNLASHPFEDAPRQFGAPRTRRRPSDGPKTALPGGRRYVQAFGLKAPTRVVHAFSTPGFLTPTPQPDTVKSLVPQGRLGETRT